jgi:hypothetical protein
MMRGVRAGRLVRKQGVSSVKKLLIVVVIGLSALAVYQWSVVRSLRAELADRGRMLAVCKQAMPTRSEVTAAAQWLHEFYKSQEGLQRPQGLWINDQPDFEGVSAWVFDTYVWSRVDGASDEDARQRIVRAIQGSDEWKLKHPGVSPK